MSQMTELTKALVELEEDKVYELVKQKIGIEEDPIKIINELNAGMSEIGVLFEKKEYYLSELILSGEILNTVMKDLEPLMTNLEKVATRDKVIIGTVKEDIHDIGKNIVVNLLEGTGFNVIDLGVNIPADQFVASVKESSAKIVGLSCLLNFTFNEMKNVVETLNDAGITGGVDEVALLPEIVKVVMKEVDVPLCIDSGDPKAIEAALKVYSEKALINSVNGEKSSLEKVLPLVKEHKTAVIALLKDENGIPEDVATRLEIAKKIIQRYSKQGIPKEDIIIDCLATEFCSI